MSRKALNKLKRKRLEEISSTVRVDLVFSSSVIPCELRSLAPVGHGEIMNVLRNGTLLAREMISLDAHNLMRWPLSNQTSRSGSTSASASSSSSASMNTLDDAAHLHFIQRAQTPNMPKFSVSSNGDDANCSISFHTIATMLNSMRAGLSLIYTSKNQHAVGAGAPTSTSCSDEHEHEHTRTRTMVLIPETGNGAQGLTLVYLHDNDNIDLPPQRTASQVVNHQNADAPKRIKRMEQEQPIGQESSSSSSSSSSSASPSIRTCTSTNNGTDTAINDSKPKPVPWDELMAQYKSCLNQEADADAQVQAPLAFVRETLDAAVKTLWAEHDKENATDADTDTDAQKGLEDPIHRVSSLYPLFHRLRPSNDTSTDGGQEEGDVLLRLKSDLSTYIKNRPLAIVTHPDSFSANTQEREHEHESESDDNDKPGAQQNEYVRMILLQVLIRLQLFTMHSINDKIKTRFLKSYSQCTSTLNTRTGTDQKQKPKSGKKGHKSKKAKHYTMRDFAEEVCSIVNLFPFVLPSLDSFRAFISEQVLEPFCSIAPDLVGEIAEILEIDLSDTSTCSDEGDSNVEVVEHESVANDANGADSIDQPVSRWSNPVLSKPAEPPTSINSSVKQERTDTIVVPESEEAILFKNRNDLALKTKRKNPLLADSKGKYVGRQFSNNYFREVKVMNTARTKKEITGSTKPHQKQKSTLNTKSIAPHATTISESPIQQPRAVARLGASSSSFRSRQQPREHVVKRSDSPCDEMPPPARHPHAAVMAALAAMRKKR